jgi:DNA-binding NtrC family response regulator
VLDDDISVLTSLADVLRAERCVVHTATRPSAAFGILRNMKVEAVISDVVMPEMDGYEFYTRVKEEMPDLPVILMTAYYYDKDHIIKRSRMRGLEGAIFKKPVNPAKLRQLLAQARQKAQAAKAERVRNTPPASNPPPPAGPASTPPAASSTRG